MEVLTKPFGLYLVILELLIDCIVLYTTNAFLNKSTPLQGDKPRRGVHVGRPAGRLHEGQGGGGVRRGRRGRRPPQEEATAGQGASGPARRDGREGRAGR